MQFSHYCACGANWEIDGASMAQIEHLIGLIDSTHRHTLGEVRATAASPAPMRTVIIDGDDSGEL
jgi:hypothetical protein